MAGQQHMIAVASGQSRGFGGKRGFLVGAARTRGMRTSTRDYVGRGMGARVQHCSSAAPWDHGTGATCSEYMVDGTLLACSRPWASMGQYGTERTCDLFLSRRDIAGCMTASTVMRQIFPTQHLWRRPLLLKVVVLLCLKAPRLAHQSTAGWQNLIFLKDRLDTERH